MTDIDQKELGNTLWNIADQLRGAMNADDFRDYMLSFLFLRYLSDNYELAAKKELGSEYPAQSEENGYSPLSKWYKNNKADIKQFEEQMRRKVHYVIKPEFLWSSIAEMARTQDSELLHRLEAGFKHIENDSFESTFQGLFSEINLSSEKLGKNYTDRNAKLCTIIQKIAEGIAKFSTRSDILGDAYEYLIGQFAAGSGKKAGEFYTPQQISSILSGIVTLDSQEPSTGKKKRLEKVLDFACGSGSLLLNVRTDDTFPKNTGGGFPLSVLDATGVPDRIGVPTNLTYQGTAHGQGASYAEGGSPSRTGIQATGDRPDAGRHRPDRPELPASKARSA